MPTMLMVQLCGICVCGISVYHTCASGTHYIEKAAATVAAGSCQCAVLRSAQGTCLVFQFDERKSEWVLVTALAPTGQFFRDSTAQTDNLPQQVTDSHTSYTL